jgi:hypothetical protein
MFLPCGELDIPDETPRSQQVYHMKFSQVAKAAMVKLDTHHKTINARVCPLRWVLMVNWYG